MAFRRSLFGYRPSEVDAALAGRDAALAEGAEALARHAAELAVCRARIAQLELVCDRLSERVVAGEGELATARAELAEVAAELARARAQEAKVEAVGAQARAQATRIRMRALRDAAELSARLEELSDAPRASRGRLLDSLQGAIERLGAEAAPNKSANGAVPGQTFEGVVEVEVGPLEDFSQLVGFEDAVDAISATSEISVRRFARGRATLDMTLAEPVELLRELEERAPFEFRVRDRRFDRLVLDLESDRR